MAQNVVYLRVFLSPREAGALAWGLLGISLKHQPGHLGVGAGAGVVAGSNPGSPGRSCTHREVETPAGAPPGADCVQGTEARVPLRLSHAGRVTLGGLPGLSARRYDADEQRPRWWWKGR